MPEDRVKPVRWYDVTLPMSVQFKTCVPPDVVPIAIWYFCIAQLSVAALHWCCGVCGLPEPPLFTSEEIVPGFVVSAWKPVAFTAMVDLVVYAMQGLVVQQMAVPEPERAARLRSTLDALAGLLEAGRVG